MMFSELCIRSCGKLDNLSRWAVITFCGWPNFLSRVFRLSLYILPLYTNSAMADLAFPVTIIVNKLTSYHRLGTLRLQCCKIGQTIRAIGADCHRTRPASILEGDPSLRLTELGLSHSVSRLAVGELVATTAMCC